MILNFSTSQRHWLNFLLAMTEKEIKVRYKRAWLGFLWVLLNPLLQMLIMGLIFQFFVPVEIDNYFLFLFAGLLPWNFFAQSLSKAAPAFFHERNLIKKANFSREVIVFSIVLANFFHFLVSLCLLIVILVADKIFLEAYGLWQLANYLVSMWPLIPAILALLIFTLFFSLLVATLNVRFRDINFITQLALNLWFYATPVIYTLQLLPPIIWPLFYLNPLTLIVELFHQALLSQPLALTQLITVSLVIIILIVYWAVLLFNRENKDFDDWL